MNNKRLLKTIEYKRMQGPKSGFLQPWDDWGAYISERQWGTVREDYSPGGDAWDYLPHDKARSTAYRWGEDGLAGISDRAQLLCFAWGFWNQNDPILKERLFGLTSNEGNHGEDVKEYYFYLDATPTQSYLKYLYKYPHKAYPYEDLVAENQRRGLNDREYELVDTGVFEENRYFDIVIEYAKSTPDDICIRVEAINRGPDAAPLHVLGQLWFRNRWTWDPNMTEIPSIQIDEEKSGYTRLVADGSAVPAGEFLSYEYKLPRYYFYGSSDAKVLFTDNETGKKDAFHKHIIDRKECKAKEGTKACFHCIAQNINPGESKVFYFRLSTSELRNPFSNIEKVFKNRQIEADEYYEAIHPESATEDEKRIQRQAISGMIWSQQFYYLDVERWLEGDDPNNPPPAERTTVRNHHWKHLRSAYTISMPDKWEYPWFASWDLAFHCLPLALISLELGKNQLSLLLRQQFQHSNGQLPAYEWEFSDLNPPVQAWTLWRLYQMEKEQTGKVDRVFLGRAFHKILINFGWWVNKVDNRGNNLFEGGFLGLDNISVIDRSVALPEGEDLEQSDGTGWIGFVSLILMRISLVLAKEDPSYYGLANKFFDNFVSIARALEECEQKDVQMWNEEEGFFYDVLCYPDGKHEQLKVRSLVGIIPLYAIEFVTQEEIDGAPQFKKYLEWHEKYRPEQMKGCMTHVPDKGYLFTLTRLHQIEKVLAYVWDKEEFRSDYGLRSISKYHKDNPFIMGENRVTYEPGESIEKIKGGNSNWRGPVWVPTTFLLIDALKNLDEALGEEELIKGVTAKELARTYAQAVIDIYRQTSKGNRPVHGDNPLFTEESWKDLVLFYEHYHGDTGRGLGASHQTGWSGLVANLIAEWCH